ncbi:AAA family ATPase [Roseovarius atlanticus]|uniref:AAA family ATPase n=1 Tax=Roseovarius atlanticus TaxID=1641875 RepID=UPI001C977A1E|nr:AAA family ATPase [Roseovarius atlanticus]MBY5989634.1 AAA family ATPase [Roseovarius atlanticus]MBY6126179.1 AAA family ATPase [Roseovarius atlanticus]MBY6150673.1 AAA family ATPase [Roseovarius atlanticus]
MSQTALIYSDDQAEAHDRIAAALREVGVDLEEGMLTPPREGKTRVMAVVGKAGSGKTLLLAALYRALEEAGVDVVSGDWEGRRRKDRRTLAILAPTNKAASVLRMRGVPATTIHRILYTPVYDPEYERIAEWLAGNGDKPEIEGLTEEALERARLFYGTHKSIPGALAAAGLRGSDFITGWKRREEPLDIGFIDEASMLDEKQYEDLQEIFPTLLLFGDPAQLAPVNQSGAMVFDGLPAPAKLTLNRIHRQDADNPILDLAHALGDPEAGFQDFERLVEQKAAQDDRVQWAQRVEVDLMARSPVLVWRNATRIRLINAFRAVHGAPDTELLEGEPLICDGLELPLKHRKKRLDLEARGLIKGAQVIYLGAGRKPGFSRLHVMGAEDPRVSAASIVKIEKPDEEEPFIPFAARMGATFLHGAAVTIHKAQGSQWPDVQVFAPDIYAAARMGRTEAGQPLWKRLAYVAITRAEERLHWVVRNRLSKPTGALRIDDLRAAPAPLELEAEEEA